MSVSAGCDSIIRVFKQTENTDLFEKDGGSKNINIYKD